MDGSTPRHSVYLKVETAMILLRLIGKIYCVFAELLSNVNHLIGFFRRRWHFSDHLQICGISVNGNTKFELIRGVICRNQTDVDNDMIQHWQRMSFKSIVTVHRYLSRPHKKYAYDIFCFVLLIVPSGLRHYHISICVWKRVRNHIDDLMPGQL